MLKTSIDAAIIAGGLGTRLDGADKGLLEWGKQRFAEHIAKKLRPYTENLIINCNRNLPRYGIIADILVHDEDKTFAGPLAGLLSVIKGSDATYVLTSPCDTPLIPDDYAPRMLAVLQQNPNRLIVAHDGNQIQPLHLLLPTNLEVNMREYLNSGKRKLTSWLILQSPVFCDFTDTAADFLNVNSPQEFNELKNLTVKNTE